MKKKAPRKNHYTGDLSFVRDFLRKLVDDTKDTLDTIAYPEGNIWYREDEGTLSLSSDQYRNYHAVLVKLTKQIAPSEDISQSTVDSALQKAVFTALDMQGLRDSNPDTRVRDAVKALREMASQEPSTFQCWTEVCGLDVKSLPASFGRVRFVFVNQYQLRRLCRTVSSKFFKRRLSKDKRVRGRCFGVVACEARDSVAARYLAEREVRATVECINFFSDLTPYNDSWLFLPGEQATTATRAIAIEEQGRYGFFSSSVGPFGGYNVRGLKHTLGIGGAVRRVHNLLRLHPRDDVQETLVTSVRWAGRATIARAHEESFLLYAIALECALLPKTGEGELSHRLSQRVAKLVGRTVASRLKYQNRMRDLYRIRSRIVHSGHYAVEEGQLWQMRDIAKGIILKLISDARVARIRKTDDLEQWYERQVLGS